MASVSDSIAIAQCRRSILHFFRLAIYLCLLLPVAAQPYHTDIAVRDQPNVDAQTCVNPYLSVEAISYLSEPLQSKYRNAVNHLYQIVTTNLSDHIHDFVTHDANRTQLRYVSKELRCLTAGVSTRELEPLTPEDPSQTSAVAKAYDPSGALSVGALAFVFLKSLNLPGAIAFGTLCVASLNFFLVMQPLADLDQACRQRVHGQWTDLRNNVLVGSVVSSFGAFVLFCANFRQNLEQALAKHESLNSPLGNLASQSVCEAWSGLSPEEQQAVRDAVSTASAQP